MTTTPPTPPACPRCGTVPTPTLTVCPHCETPMPKITRHGGPNPPPPADATDDDATPTDDATTAAADPEVEAAGDATTADPEVETDADATTAPVADAGGPAGADPAGGPTVDAARPSTGDGGPGPQDAEAPVRPNQSDRKAEWVAYAEAVDPAGFRRQGQAADDVNKDDLISIYSEDPADTDG